MDWSPPFLVTTTLTDTDAAASAPQCLAVQAAAQKVTASSVADKDGTLGTRYFEVTASPSPSTLAVAPARPPCWLCSPTDHPPALPAPRSWHSLGSLGFGLGLRCLVPSGHGRISLLSPAGRPACCPPRVGPPRAGKHEESRAAGGLNSLPHFLFSHSPSSSDLAGNEIAAAGTGVGKRDISKVSGPRQAWRSRYILTETCIWIEHLAIHGACLLAPDTQAWQDLGPDLGTGGARLALPSIGTRQCSVVASTRDIMVPSGVLVLGHLSLLPLCFTKGPRTMLVLTLVVRLF